MTWVGRGIIPPARLPRGPAWLSIKSGAPVLPALLLRQEDDTFLLRLAPPILPEVAGSMEAVRDRICRFLEREIGERPYQWFIFEDFWKGAEATAAGTEQAT